MKKEHVRAGLEVFLERGLSDLEGMSVGLITNDTGIDRSLRSTIDLLFSSEQVHLRALFGPEHGMQGNAQDGVAVGEMVDQRMGLPIYSLYGDTLRPTPETLQGLHALIYDIQDVGARYYTYLTTLAYAQEAAAQAGLLFVVFDRPNPITGMHVEGNMLDLRFTSFVGVDALPVRHGLTSGELARYFANRHGWPQPLVVPVEGWRRGMWFDETGLPWVQPSPNMPTLTTATLYPGTCLLEGTNLSEGRGTTHPFEVLGAPWLDPFPFADAMTKRALPGVAFRPLSFTPMFSKYKQRPCGGVQVHILERDLVRPVEVGLHLLHAALHLHPEQFAWRQGPADDSPIDRLFGSDQLRLALNTGGEVVAITRVWPEPLALFREHCRSCFLYER